MDTSTQTEKPHEAKSNGLFLWIFIGINVIFALLVVIKVILGK